MLLLLLLLLVADSSKEPVAVDIMLNESPSLPAGGALTMHGLRHVTGTSSSDNE